MTNSVMLSVNVRDLLRGAVTAVVAAVVVGLYSVVTVPGFDFFAADWVSIGKVTFNAAAGAFIGYLGKNLLSDANGKFGGVL